jgi:hypothetical protein
MSGTLSYCVSLLSELGCLVRCPIVCLYFLSLDVWYDFRINLMFDWSLPKVACIVMSYLRYLCLFAHSGIHHILCCVFALFVCVLRAPWCRFLWIFLF